MTDFVVQAPSTLRAGGARVTLRVLGDADPFLLFSHEKEALAQPGSWLAPLLGEPVRDAATETPPRS